MNSNRIHIIAAMATCFLLALLFGCSRNALERQLQCLDERIRQGESKPDYIAAQNAFKDTLNNWISLGIRTVQSYEKDRWKIDGVLLNNDEDKGLIVVLEVDPNTGAALDYIEIFAMERHNGIWSFYSAGLPSFIMPREYNGGHAHTYDQLSRYARETIIKAGYYKGNSCEISDSYIDFLMPPDRKQRHREFLKDTMK